MMQDQETVEMEESFERERRGETSNSDDDFNSPDITMSSSSDDEDDETLKYFAALAE
jgi:hypothetical protein